MADQRCLIELKDMVTAVNWESEGERYTLFHQIYPLLVRSWDGPLPDLRDIFRREEIEHLLSDIILDYGYSYLTMRLRFIKFLIETGYKDEPEMDEDGKPLLNRITPIHLVARCNSRNWENVIRDLFNIYDNFDVNYVDETGLSHFYVACMYDCREIAEKFLELGQDPNCRWPKTGESPLHLALNSGNRALIELLLRRGADPNLADSRGFTALHVICRKVYEVDDHLVDLIFEINDEKDQLVEIDARDKFGRTPLQLAVANFLLDTIEALLDYGADLSSFTFPTENYIGENFVLDRCANSNMLLVSGVLVVVERLEDRGYELDLSDAQKIIKFFVKRGMFQTSKKSRKFPFIDRELAIVASDFIIRPSLSVYDLIWSRPAELADKKVTYEDYFMFASSYSAEKLPTKLRDSCCEHLCERLSWGFCRTWALNSFWELIRYQLPIECCTEVIFVHLKIEDLVSICLSIKKPSHQDSKQKNVVKKNIPDKIECGIKRPKRTVKPPERLQIVWSR